LRAFANDFSVGPLVCPFCKKKQKRVITELDLMLFLLWETLILAIAVSCSYLVVSKSEKLWLYVLICAGILILAWQLLSLGARVIYRYAPFKKAWAYLPYSQNTEEVRKRQRYQFLLVLVIVVVFGTMEEVQWLYWLMVPAVMLINGVKAVLLYRNEKNYFVKKK